MKTCSKCKRELEVEKFSRNRATKDGLKRSCKDCDREYNENNKERIKERRQEYRKNNFDRIKERGKKYKKEYYENNKERNKEHIKEYNKSKSLYSTYFNQLTVEEDPISDENGYLMVRCTYCKEYYYPTNREVKNRINCLNGKNPGECRLYCSDSCKSVCPLYGFNSYRHFQPGSKEWEERQNKEPDRDPKLQADWRKMILERDDYKCVKCGSTDNLVAHHVEGIHWNPLESLDLDIGVTLCEDCNRKAHSLEGCSYYDMQCK